MYNPQFGTKLAVKDMSGQQDEQISIMEKPALMR